VESGCWYSSSWTVQKAVCEANHDFSVQWKYVAFCGKEEDIANIGLKFSQIKPTNAQYLVFYVTFIPASPQHVSAFLLAFARALL
jgi:hypothetical protein